MTSNSIIKEAAEVMLLTMGGTLDKDYFDALSEYQVVETTLIDDIQRLGIELNTQVQSIAKKDSLELTEQDRIRLCEEIEGTRSPKILVSHGTDTMVETALFLRKNLSEQSLSSKTIVFFGAMRPSRFKDSDAQFNFAFALGAMQNQTPGLYIAMSAQVFLPEDVAKNRQQQRFERTDA